MRFPDSLQEKFLVEPVPEHSVALGEVRLVGGAHDDRRVRVDGVVDVDGVLAPAERVQGRDHAKLVGCESQGGDGVLEEGFGFGFLLALAARIGFGATGGGGGSLEGRLGLRGFFFGAGDQILVALGAVQVLVDVLDCLSHPRDEERDSVVV